MNTNQGKALSAKRKEHKKQEHVSPPLSPSPLTLHPFRGFTLIELLVVIAITGIMVVIGTNIFISVLRSANKATILTQIQENGSTSLQQISRIVDNAAAVVYPTNATPCPGNKCDHIIVQNKVLDVNQPLYTEISLVQPGGTANGYIAINSNQSLSTLENYTAAQIAAGAVTNNNAAANAVDLATNPAPYFTVAGPVVDSTGANTTVVIVSYTLQQSKNQSASYTRENSGTLPFLSSFTLRSY